MLVANSFDLWQKDTFFSAAEEVQQSADIMESAYRTWTRARREGLMPHHLDEERELQMALGTAKWQLEEFERAVRMSYRSRGDDVTISRHRQFITTMEDQISRVEKELKESFNVEGKKPFRWVNLDKDECDDFALFLSGKSQTSTDQSVTDSLDDKSNNCSEFSSKNNKTSNGEKSIEEYSISNEGVKEESRIQETGNRRMWTPPNKSALEIVIVSGDEKKNALTEALPNEKGSKGAKVGAINHTQLKMINWINQRLRGGQRSQRQQLVRPVNSMRFILALMLTIFLVVPFLVYST
ncbi:hypothetical protein ABFS83_10G139300 [Erythranthe nasuta]